MPDINHMTTSDDVPNLTYGHGKSNSKKAVDKLKDEHKCLRLITDQIVGGDRNLVTLVQ